MWTVFCCSPAYFFCNTTVFRLITIVRIILCRQYTWLCHRLWHSLNSFQYSYQRKPPKVLTWESPSVICIQTDVAVSPSSQVVRLVTATWMACNLQLVTLSYSLGGLGEKPFCPLLPQYSYIFFQIIPESRGKNPGMPLWESPSIRLVPDFLLFHLFLE